TMGMCFSLSSPICVLRRLQIVQNAAACLLMAIPRTASAKPALASLHWLPIQQRITFKALCVVNRALHNRGPSYIKCMITPYTPQRALRSSSAGLVDICRVKKQDGEVGPSHSKQRIYGIPS
ncbi:hypothetical protein NDU88_005711, partial [Pleurodeles waltl]